MTCASINFKVRRYHATLDTLNPLRVYGKVSRLIGIVIEGIGPGASVGTLCDIYPHGSSTPIRAEVVGFQKNRIFLMPIGSTSGIAPGSRIVALNVKPTVPVSSHMLGRVLDGMGNPIDDRGPLACECNYPLYVDPINPLHRQIISEPLDVGIKAINGFLTCGKGQRMGIFAGSGVGKSVLLGMIAKNTKADVTVIGLVGERGREVREFIERDLGFEGLQKAVVVAATSDQPPLIRIRGAHVATAIAEFFRDQGKDVLLLMDSITRLAMAQREIGLATGEPPTTKGYTPSVFSFLPRLLERAGNVSRSGSITGMYTILVEGDDMNDPVADTVRSILDGHIVLSRDLANRGHYPAIDVLQSISRVMPYIIPAHHMECVQKLLAVLDTYKKSEDLIKIGAYLKGSNKQIDHAISLIDKINAFLQQQQNEKFTLEQSVAAMQTLVQLS
ncbi:MAG: flagellar protein export ATPase FliI [Desulfobacterota bacterium]|nr:flagellar protein export ATPase FliI [Thermodesulfobacteriota bacterium]